MTDTHVRISLTTSEFEVQGSESFVDRYSDIIDELLNQLKEPAASRSSQRRAASGAVDDFPASEAADVGSPRGLAREFGEVLHELAKNTTDTDKILLAGFYVAQNTNDKTFATGDANKLLIAQGIKVSNASQCMRQNLSTKRAFKTAGNRWRVAKPGEEHLKTLGLSV